MIVIIFPLLSEQISELVASVNGESTLTAERNTQAEENGEFNYNSEKLILYALGIGVNIDEPYHLRYLNESDGEFSAFPTFGVIPGLDGFMQSDIFHKITKQYGIVIDPSRILHGEQYLEIRNPVPTEAKLRSEARVIDVLDKGSGAVVIAEVDSLDSEGKSIFYNQFTLFLVGSGKFGGKRSSDNPQIKQVISPPNRPADAIVTEKTSINQVRIEISSKVLFLIVVSCYFVLGCFVSSLWR